MSISSLAAVQIHAAFQPAKSQQPRVPEQDPSTAFRNPEHELASAVVETRRSVNILV